MSDYKDPRPSPTASASDPCVIYDNAVSFNEVVNGDAIVTTYTGKQIISLSQAIDKFGFGVAPFTFAVGGTLGSFNFLVSNSPVDNFFYKYVGTGAAPLVIAPSFDPSASADWDEFIATDAKFITSANVTVSGIKNLVVPTVTGQSFSVTGFYSGTTVGGGDFIYDASKDKADHNGGTVIAPEAIAAWDGSATNIATLLNWTGTGVGCFVRDTDLAKRINPRIFGALIDDATDDYLALNALNLYLSSQGGGVISWVGILRSGTQFTMADKVSIIGTGGYRAYASYPTTLYVTHSGIGIYTAPSGRGHALNSLLVTGNGNCSIGIQSNSQIEIKNTAVRFTREQGVFHKSAGACVFEDIISIDTLSDRLAFTVVKGSVEIEGNDHFLNRIEANAATGFSTVVAGKKSVALYIKGSNHFVDSCIGEFGEIGILASCTRTRFSMCRADRNFGDGYLTDGTNNTFSACASIENSTGATGVHDGFKTTGANNQFAGCFVNTPAGQAIVNIGFNDTVTTTGNIGGYVGCKVNDGAANIKFKNNDFLGTGFTFSDSWDRASDNSTTIDVSGRSNIALNYSATVSVTGFVNGTNGQELSLIGDPDVTLINSSTLRLANRKNFTMLTSYIYKFKMYNGVWYEYQAGLDALSISDTASLNSAASALNTVNKYQGKQTFNNNTNKPLWATGSLATSTWVDGVGAVIHTPT
jgi:hypothetical protein